MDIIHSFLDFFLHLDTRLAQLITEYGNWIYALLFLIIFVETGIVIFPFLPGDSLLFAAGAFASAGTLNIFILLPLCFAAAVLGNTSNYSIGRFFGKRALNIKYRGKPIVKQQYLDRTHNFYEKYGTKTLIITRFIPIIRTISPFVAGLGKMTPARFTLYNIIGAFVWVIPITLLGYLFGQNEFVKKNFEFVALAIIFISVIPVIIELIKRRSSLKKSPDSK